MPDLQKGRVLERYQDSYSSRLSDDSTFNNSMMSESDDVEIPVWVGGIEKWVTGLTKRTTCDDVIYALLCHEGNPQGFVDVPSYVICEQWKGVERQLNGRTKIVKLWRTWGSDVRRVRFYLRKIEYVEPAEVNRSRRSKVHPQRRNGYQDTYEQDYRRNERSRERDCISGEHYDATRRRSRSVEPRSGKTESSRGRIAHHELEHVNAATFERDAEAKALQQLMSVLMEQERKLREQNGRLKEIDVQIENYESKTHFSRMRKNGQNYVQEAYLTDKGDESSSSSGEESYVSAKAREMENYLDLCESLVKMESKLCAEHNKIDDLSLLLCEQSVLEMSLPTRRTITAETSNDEHSSPNKSSEESGMKELESLKNDLHRSLSTGVAQQQELERVTQALNEWDLQLQEKTVLLDSLLLEVNELEMNERLETKESKNVSGSRENIFESERNKSNTLQITTSEDLNKTETNGPIQQIHLPKTSTPQCNVDSAILADLHSNARSRVESQTSDWDWENELPMTAQKNLSARSMIPYRTYTTYEDNAGSGLGLANSLKHTALDDSNSDTGLSSLHSDEAPPILETLV